MTEADFFNSFHSNQWDLLYVDEAYDNQPVVQVGLVATFYLQGAYTPARRRDIAEAFELYCQFYGHHLTWGYMGGENITQYDFNKITQQNCTSYIMSESPSEPVSFRWSSAKGFNATGDYMFQALSPSDWFEQVHHALSTIRLYLPVDTLKGNREAFDTFIASLCSLLKPLHGSAGFGIQNCHEHQNYQHTEYEILATYRGVDLSLLIANHSWQSGYCGLNWYTYINNSWIKNLSSQQPSLELFNDTRIVITHDEFTTIIKAGGWPELGKSDINPHPELYVKVNDVIKSLRTPDIGSLHYGSIAGETRFNVRTSNLWLRRFDLPPGHSAPTPPRQYYRYSAEEIRKIEEDRAIFDSLLTPLPQHKP